LRWSRSSGEFASFTLAPAPNPDAIATNCLPLTSNVIGGAEKPEPTLICVVVRRDGAVQEREEHQTAARREGAAEVRVRQVHVLLDLAGEGIDGGEVAFVTFRRPIAAARPYEPAVGFSGDREVLVVGHVLPRAPSGHVSATIDAPDAHSDPMAIPTRNRNTANDHQLNANAVNPS
jgi:hypothetical protein